MSMQPFKQNTFLLHIYATFQGIIVYNDFLNELKLHDMLLKQ